MKKGNGCIVFGCSLVLILCIACSCLSMAWFYLDSLAGTTQASTSTAPEFAPDNTFEVKCVHQNAGSFMLEPGYSINGGHVWVTGTEYLFVDDRVVVVTNNSSEAIEVSSSDGVGLCNDVDYDRQVAMRFVEGCDPDGCTEVKWVNITDNGTKVTILTKQ